MKKFWLYLIILFATILFSVKSVGQETIDRVVLGAMPVGGHVITFEDLSTGISWHVDLPQQYSHNLTWSPRGCEILLRGSRSWDILSILSGSVHSISQSVNAVSSIKSPIWHPNSETITYTFSTNFEGTTEAYNYNFQTDETNQLFALESTGRVIEWLSPEELLYETNSSLMLYNTISEQSVIVYENLQMPDDWYIPYYLIEISPDQLHLSRYYSAIWNYLYPIEDVNDEDIEIVSGVDIFSRTSGTLEHISFDNLLLQSLVWSPSSTKFIGTTFPESNSDDLNGLYIHDFESNTTDRVGDFISMYNIEYGDYRPSWSNDETMLAFNTSTGYITYNLITEEIIQLSSDFTNTYMELSWSPTMNYSDNQCE